MKYSVIFFFLLSIITNQCQAQTIEQHEQFLWNSYSSLKNDKIKWVKNFEEAMSQGVAKGRPIFVGGSSREEGTKKSTKFCLGYRLFIQKIHRDQNLIDFINNETIPVRLDITENGFPKGIPAIKRWKEFVDKSPWPRLGFGHWFLLGPNGKHVFMTDAYYWHMPLVESDVFLPNEIMQRIEKGTIRFKKYWKLKNRSDAIALETVRKTLKEVDDEANNYYDEATNLHAITIRFLVNKSAMPFWDIIKTINENMNNKKVAPGFKEDVINSLGDLLVSQKNFSDRVLLWLAHIYRLPPTTKWPDIYKSSGWKKTEHTAALALVKLLGLNWKTNDPNLVNDVKTWWLQNRNSKRFKVNCSGNGCKKYDFTL